MIGYCCRLNNWRQNSVYYYFCNFNCTWQVYDQDQAKCRMHSGKTIKIYCNHAGLTLRRDGATHQILEDIGLIKKMLPGMTVIVPY